MKNRGQKDNTLLIDIVGDNGAMPAGGLNGIYKEIPALNGRQQDPKLVLSHLSEDTFLGVWQKPHISIGVLPLNTNELAGRLLTSEAIILSHICPSVFYSPEHLNITI